MISSVTLISNGNPDTDAPNAETPEDQAAIDQLANDFRNAAAAGYVEKKEQLERIFALEDEVARCEADYLAKAESSKNAKKHLEAAQDALNRFIRKLKEHLPLFDKPASAPEPEPWREDSVRLLESLSESVYEAFEEAGLFTIGQLCDWRKEHELTELAGIGAAKVTKIEDALEAYWASHNIVEPDEESGEEEA